MTAKTMACAVCDEPMWRSPTSLPEGQATCNPCRRVRKGRPPDSPDGIGRVPDACDSCGTPIYRRTGAPQPRCQSCRRTTYPKCADCGGAVKTRRATRCWACYNKTRPATDPNKRVTAKRRADREHATAGLTRTQMDTLRNKWKRQGKSCIFCLEPADQIDHIIPIARGGTSYEGNLAPCCARCNRRKNDRLITEWRHGRACSTYERVWAEPRPQAQRTIQAWMLKQWTQQTLSLCVICDTLSVKKRTCSTECEAERFRRYMRDKYRAKAGLPVNPSEPTKPWLRMGRAA